MTLETFCTSLSTAEPPKALPPALVALWHDGRGDWEAAHRVAQDIDDADGAWVHAYLHRKEGDLSNARYWYRAAEETVSESSHADEWAEIVAELLADV